jgi:plasmid stability protein
MPAAASFAGMATLSIRNLPDDVHRALRVRAAGHGRSMEAEAREILAETLGSGESARATLRDLQAWIDRAYGSDKPAGVVDDLIAERRREAMRE